MAPPAPKLSNGTLACHAGVTATVMKVSYILCQRVSVDHALDDLEIHCLPSFDIPLL